MFSGSVNLINLLFCHLLECLEQYNKKYHEHQRRKRKEYSINAERKLLDVDGIIGIKVPTGFGIIRHRKIFTCPW